MTFRDRVDATKKIMRERLERFEADVSEIEMYPIHQTTKGRNVFSIVPYQSALGRSRVKTIEYLEIALYELKKEKEQREGDT